jgi:Asp/Glu/hydantoin racemase
LLDEALYADAGPDGVLPPDLPGRVASVLRHARDSRADGLIFTGSTFGPAVEAARSELGIPLLKADEAMCDLIAAKTGRVVIACTAARALPVIRANVAAAARALGTAPEVSELWVAGAKEAITAGDFALHDRLIAEAVSACEADWIALGQISMVPSRGLLESAIAARVITGPDASVRRMRELVDA